MAQKNATPSKAQEDILRAHSLRPQLYTVVKDLPNSLIIKHRISGEFQVVEK